MRIQIKNCVTNPAYKALRASGNPTFKPLILGQVLMPNAIRLVESEDFNKQAVMSLESLVKSGSCLATEVGVGPVNFPEWLLSFPSEAPEVIEEPQEEEAPVIEEEPEPVEASSGDDTLSFEEEEVESEEIIDEEPSIYTESELLEMRNADLRELALSINPEAGVSNKSKKKLISLILEIQNG